MAGSKRHDPSKEHGEASRITDLADVSGMIVTPFQVPVNQ
jgi:hypothetical protein